MAMPGREAFSASTRFPSLPLNGTTERLALESDTPSSVLLERRTPPELHQLLLFEDTPSSRDPRQAEPALTTLIRVAQGDPDRKRQLLALAIFLEACELVSQARPSDRVLAEAILREGGVYQGALAQAETSKEVKSLRGHFSQRARYLTHLVEKMTSHPRFLASFR